MRAFDEVKAAAWWADVLARDERGRERDETYAEAYRRLLRCVICNRNLEEDLRDSLRSRSRHEVAMVAYWHRPDMTVFASGLYCHGERGCYVFAENIGFLGDMHAENYAGPKNALYGLAARVIDQPRWEPTALRRMVLVFTALAALPVSKTRERNLYG